MLTFLVWGTRCWSSLVAGLASRQPHLLYFFLSSAGPGADWQQWYSAYTPWPQASCSGVGPSFFEHRKYPIVKAARGSGGTDEGTTCSCQCSSGPLCEGEAWGSVPGHIAGSRVLAMLPEAAHCSGWIPGGLWAPGCRHLIQVPYYPLPSVFRTQLHFLLGPQSWAL